MSAPEGQVVWLYGPPCVGKSVTADRRGSAFVVDTGDGDPRDVARRVLELVPTSPKPAVGSVSSRTPTPPSVVTGLERAILFYGPTGVGKSTIGFSLFASLLSAGRAAAFLDLQQLGFLADVSLSASMRHRLIAECVADLGQLYRAVGAQDLVLVGRVEEPEDVQRYRNALGATSLLVCRLRAGPERLRERLHARRRGGGPELAGDTLRGIPAADVEAVLERALAQQAHLDEVAVGDVVLDTDDLEPAEVVQKVPLRPHN